MLVRSYLRKRLAERVERVLQLRLGLVGQVALDLRPIDEDRPDDRPMIVAEDPAYALHRWNGRELVSFYDHAGAHTMLAKYDANLQPLVRELKAERPA